MLRTSFLFGQGTEEHRKGGRMDVATIVRVIAVACAGLLARIFFGYRMVYKR